MSCVRFERTAVPPTAVLSVVYSRHRSKLLNDTKAQRSKQKRQYANLCKVLITSLTAALMTGYFMQAKKDSRVPVRYVGHTTVICMKCQLRLLEIGYI